MQAPLGSSPIPDRIASRTRSAQESRDLPWIAAVNGSPCSESVRSKATLRHSFTLRQRCPACGQWLRIAPDVERGINISAILTLFVLSFAARPSVWYEYLLPVVAMVVVGLIGGWLAVRWLPMRHASEAEMILGGYRLPLAVVLVFGLTLFLTYLAYRVPG
ncbi:MAG: hypothetical protein R3F15_00940 [Lysobacterales bacterium]